LSWAASVSSAAGDLTYRVFRNGKAIGTKSTALTYVDSPAANKSYTYKVKAVDSRGVSSAFSASITVEVPPPSQLGTDVTPPSTPIGLTAVSLEARQVYLSWQPSTDDQDGLIMYKVFRNSVVIGTATAASFVDSASAAGTYNYTVKAIDAAGNKSPLSASVKGYAFD
jgi:chitin-binding protein